MRLSTPLFALGLAVPAAAQTITSIPLNYNFNGIVHSGENGMPDDPDGFRSISDRALDFTAGVPGNALLASYQLVTTAGALDIVHIGDRNVVDGGARVFDAMADGDDLGIQPNWLPAVDQSGPQMTTLAAPVSLSGNTVASFLLQVSNGGGSLDVVFVFQSGATTTGTIGAGDWFGGPFSGTAGTDSAVTDNPLSITESIIDLTAFSGETLVSVTFQNRSNLNAGYAVLAGNVETGQPPVFTTPLPLSYNFNGIVHAGEEGLPDEPNGYRSISDRGLNFTAGVPANPLSDPFVLVGQANVLDVVHLGDRNLTDAGSRPWDLTANGDDIGIQPTWLPNSDQTNAQVTTLASPVGIGAAAELKVLFQISNGGGSFVVTAGFQSGASATGVLVGGDWFGGTFAGTAGVDTGVADANLNLTVGTLNLGAFVGEVLTSVSFSQGSNPNAGIAIVAANVESSGIGTAFCSPNPNSTGVPGRISAIGSAVAADNNVTLTVANIPAFQFGIFTVSDSAGASVLVNEGVLCLSGEIGRYQQAGQIYQADGGGSASFMIDLTSIPRPMSIDSTMPGDTWFFQAWHRDFVNGDPGQGNTSNFTDGVRITFS